jgi:hypothetical protein
LKDLTPTWKTDAVLIRLLKFGSPGLRYLAKASKLASNTHDDTFLGVCMTALAVQVTADLHGGDAPIRHGKELEQK